MASTGKAGRVRFVVAAIGALVAAIALFGPVWWEATHHRQRTGIAGYDYPAAAPLSGYDDPRLARRDGEGSLTYVRRATRVVGSAIYHCDNDDPDQDWRTAVLGRVAGDGLLANEGILHPRYLRCGLCSQSATVLAAVLRRNGVESADTYGLDGHVVVEFTHRGESFVTDPDFGVGPMRVEWDDPQQLRSAVTVAYADPMAWPVARVQGIYADTSDDPGEYDRRRMAVIASAQGVALAALGWLRWAVVAAGVVVVAVTSRRAA